MKMGSAAFERLVARVLEDLPQEFAELLDNVAVVVEEEPSPEDLEAVGLDPGEDELFGLYQGIPQTDRDSAYAALPDRIAIYRRPILRCCQTSQEVAAEVRDTVIHELGHHFGLADDEMPY